MEENVIYETEIANEPVESAPMEIVYANNEESEGGLESLLKLAIVGGVGFLAGRFAKPAWNKVKTFGKNFKKAMAESKEPKKEEKPIEVKAEVVENPNANAYVYKN